MRHNQNHKAPKDGSCAACKAEEFYDKATKIVKLQVRSMKWYNLER